MNIRKYTSYYKEIGKLALPLFIGQLGTIALAFADNIMVGYYSTEALASASFVNNFFNLAIFACVGFTYGLTPLLGALFSRAESDRIGALTRTGMRVNIIFSVILSALMLGVYFFLDAFGQPEELMPLIRPYYLIVLAGIIPVVVFNVLAQWSYAIGNTSTPTWIVLGCNALNVLGNYVLIYGHFGFPEKGLLGAGISTLVSRVLTAVAMMLVFFRFSAGAPYRAGFRKGEYKKGDVAVVVRTGFPVSMQMFFETASFSGSAIIAGWLGAIELAAFQIIAISGMLGFCLYYSIGAAMAIPLSHAQGRGDNKGMRRTALAGYHLILICMLCSCSIFLFGGRLIMGLFTPDHAVLAMALSVLVPLVLYQAGDATQITFANALRGTTHVMPMLWIAFVSYMLVGLPLTYLMAIPFGLGLYGIVLSFSVCLMLAGVLYLLFFLRATHQRKHFSEKCCACA